MKHYTITCTVCGVAEEGWAYTDERISHTHTVTGAPIGGRVRIAVTR